ncbi:MAG: hypothetical protein JSV86_03950 [Gemmatimonadota bacterium]|nr:MAG: hypothetical protein JSV86_03950 [Gemmatimonadota bacterium]
MMRIARLLALAAMLVAGGCMDLDVTNPNEPDRERALSDPADVEAIISTSFREVFLNSQDNYPNLSLAAMADNVTGGFYDYSVHDLSTEPRSAWNNSSLNTRSGVNSDPWLQLYRAISSVNDGLGAINRGLRILEIAPPDTIDHTPRARAFAKLVQGIAFGYLATHFDQAIIVTEYTDLEELDPTEYAPYQAVLDTAIWALDEAIEIAAVNDFETPAATDWVNGMALTNEEVVQIANTFVARFLAYTPRSWEDRAAVDWDEVLTRINAGITRDLAPQGELDVWESNMRRLLARVRARPGDHARMDYMALGPGDVSGGFQTWFATPSADRMPFQMDSPDRRIQGPTGPDEAGTYFAYNLNSIWPSSRGTYRWSWYYYLRLGAGDTWYVGPQPWVTTAEMDLLKAEALIRLGREDEAVPLINLTREASGELPPVTVDGPPDDPNCVPKQMAGGCGSLWDALVYEKNLEVAAREGAVSWWDGRGWGTLQQGSLIHFPVRGAELENMGVPQYTFGGTGEGAAPAPQYNRCPVALPRCP